MDMIDLISSLVSSWSAIYPLILKLLLALILLLIGLLIARILEKVIILFMKIIRLDSIAEQIGFDSLLQKGNVRKKSSELVGSLVYWIVVFVAVVTVAGTMGLMIEDALTKVFAYMGIVFLAAFILGVGLFLAGLISGIVRLILANLGLEGDIIVSRIIYYIIIIFAFLAALAELGISTDVFVPQIGVIIGAVGLAAAIAFGLGCKDMAADFLHNLFKGK